MKIVNVTIEVHSEPIDGWDYEYYALLKFNHRTAMKVKMKYGYDEDDALEVIADKLWELTSAKDED